MIGIIVGKQFFDERFLLCQFIAAICLVSCETSLMNIAFLALNRLEIRFLIGESTQ